VRGGVSRFVGTRLRSMRMRARASAGEVARATGVSESTVRKWESGAVKPRPQHLSALAKVFDVPAVDFVQTTATPTMQELRERCALTQEEVAARAGVSTSTVAAIESGSQQPSADARGSLAESYGVGVEALDDAWRRSADKLEARGRAVRHTNR